MRTAADGMYLPLFAAEGPAGFNSNTLVACLTVAALTVALGSLLHRPRRSRRILAAVLGVPGLAGLWWLAVDRLTPNVGFWLMAALAIGAAVATIASRSAVYSAIWFAASLLGTGGLMLVQGAQFLGIATVVVYAGAIVVTFLFVLMLVPPQGQSFFERISWNWSGGTRWYLPAPPWWVALAATTFVVLVATALPYLNRTAPQLRQVLETQFSQWRAEGDPAALAVQLQAAQVTLTRDGQPQLRLALAGDADAQAVLARRTAQLNQAAAQYDPRLATVPIVFSTEDILADQHVAVLGGHLFGYHLIAIEVAGVLLLVALVGAIAIASHGNDRSKTAKGTL